MPDRIASHDDETTAAEMRALMSSLVGTLAYAGGAVVCTPQRRRSLESLARMSESELKLFMASAHGADLAAAEAEYLARCAAQPLSF